MKKHKFTVMSKVKCPCGTPIKQSMVDRKAPGTPLSCFPCFREENANHGHDMSTAREIRQGKKPAKKYRETIAETIKRHAKEKLNAA